MGIIDLSRLPAPDAIEALDYEGLLADYIERFIAFWDQQRARDPSLPEYTVGGLETDPAVVVGQAFSYLRLLDRARVNNAIRSVLAPFAKGTNLDVIAARQNVERLEIAPDVMESDEQLLNRYLLSFGRASAGSADRLLFDAWTAWPGMLDARVNGRAIHGRRGETDLVVAGPGGVTPPDKLALVRAAVTSTSAKPEAIGIAVMAAEPLEYSVRQLLKIRDGVDVDLVVDEAANRIKAAADERTRIGVTIQRDLLAGASFGASISGSVHEAPASDIVPTPYQIPVCTDIDLSVEHLQ